MLYCVGFEAKILHKPCIKPALNPTWELRVKETKRLRDKETKRQRGGAYPNPSLKGRALLRR